MVVRNFWSRRDGFAEGWRIGVPTHPASRTHIDGMLTAEGKQWNVELFYSDTAHAHNDRRMPNISTLGIGEKLKFHLFFQNRCNLRFSPYPSLLVRRTHVWAKNWNTRFDIAGSPRGISNLWMKIAKRFGVVLVFGMVANWDSKKIRTCVCHDCSPSM